MTTDSRDFHYAFRRGEAAFRDGISLKDCPFPPGSLGRILWRKSWVAENKKEEEKGLANGN